MFAPTCQRLLRACRKANAVIGLALAAWFLLLPVLITLYFLHDPNLRTGQPPRAAFWLHQRLSPRYEHWARERVASDRAAELATTDLVETEWPVFGSMFYLWSTEALQEAWEQDPTLGPEPMAYARGTVDAATALILDPNHGTWVRKHWGEAYLEHENCFYRMLLIGAMTVNTRLTGTSEYLPRLRETVEALAADIDASPRGLIEDYPGECYPSDVVAAVACILRADAVLGTDHRAFAARALRGFEGNALDHGLPPFLSDRNHGTPIDPARGCSNSYTLLFAPEVWPDAAHGWYDAYDRHFWSAGPMTAGFREYPRGHAAPDWGMNDMDAGPVVNGLGVAASAFGLGAARANGRLDHAYTLTVQMLAASWILPDGMLLFPRALSRTLDAPLLGEACIVYNISRTVVATGGDPARGYTPLLVWLMLGGGLFAAMVVIFAAVGVFREPIPSAITFPRAQIGVWAALACAGLALMAAGQLAAGVTCLLLMQLLPLRRHRLPRLVLNWLGKRPAIAHAVDSKWLS